jgi:t-SNARE complex subunit (syntaxin)
MTFVSLSSLCDWLPNYTLTCQMSILVEQQDETINTIEAQATEVEKDVETG